MRLLIVNDRLTYSSASFYSLDLAIALKSQGHDVRVCTRGGELRELFAERGVRTYAVKSNLFSYRKLLGFLREFSPELIHVHSVPSVETGQRLSVKLGVPHVLTVQRVPATHDLRLRHRLLAGVLAGNEMIRAALVNEQEISKSLIRVVKHGVNVDAFVPSPREETATEWIPVVGSVGRLARGKGVDIFLRAARISLDRGVEVMFMIVGEGEEEKNLRRMVKTLDLEEQVTFLPHMPSRRELYRIFDVIVIPAMRGGVGSTVLEAMATAKPVITTAVGASLQLVDHERTGLLVEENNAEALADAIVRTVKDRELARTLGEAARQFTCEEYPLSDMVREVVEFYDEVQTQLVEAGLEQT